MATRNTFSTLGSLRNVDSHGLDQEKHPADQTADGIVNALPGTRYEARDARTSHSEPGWNPVTASAALAQFLLNRFQPFSESAIYGAGFSWSDSSRGDVGQYSALKHCDLV
jgi:hypothetical protein